MGASGQVQKCLFSRQGVRRCLYQGSQAFAIERRTTAKEIVEARISFWIF